MRHAIAAALLFLALPIAGCKGKPAEPPPDEAEAAEDLSCTKTSECADGWTCLGGQCTDPASGAIYTDPSNAVTPDKVKKEIEMRTKEAEGGAAEKALGL